MKPYEIIGHTADIGIRASGRTIKELFENAARGMFAVIFGENKDGHEAESRDPAAITSRKIEIKKEIFRYEDLLVFWLSELLYVFDQESIVFKDFRILELTNSGISAETSTSRIDLSRDVMRREIKAVTFSDLNIEESEHGFTCKVIFDV
ncbi:MAG: archease [Candidatus Omnitrophota bacterium]